jgi:putative tryptophan/tyrosine transport system substrate-binding protein
MSYRPNGAQVFRQAAFYVDRIPEGAKPGELPIRQPNCLELVINLKTARAMGLTVPPWLLARADAVVE